LVQEIFKKVKVIVDESIPEKGEFCPITMSLWTVRECKYTATIQKGHAKNPLTEEEVLAKFRDNVKEGFSRERGDDIIACVRSLETVSNVNQLTRLLAINTAD
jgi:2-methylcitrate dehydratase PrpD